MTITSKTAWRGWLIGFGDPLLPGLAQNCLEALMATVPGTIKKAHVIILHRPVCFHHCLLCWQPGVHLINESLPGADLPHHADCQIFWIEAHSVRIM